MVPKGSYEQKDFTLTKSNLSSQECCGHPSKEMVEFMEAKGYTMTHQLEVPTAFPTGPKAGGMLLYRVWQTPDVRVAVPYATGGFPKRGTAECPALELAQAAQTPP